MYLPFKGVSVVKQKAIKVNEKLPAIDGFVSMPTCRAKLQTLFLIPQHITHTKKVVTPLQSKNLHRMHKCTDVNLPSFHEI